MSLTPRPGSSLLLVLPLLAVAACGGGSHDGPDPSGLSLDAVEPPYAVEGHTETVLLRGRGFATGEVRVFFNEQEAPQVEVLDDQHLRCDLPLLDSGPIVIRIETAAGEATLVGGLHGVLDRLEDYHYVAQQGIADDAIASTHWGTVSLDPVDGLLYGSHEGSTGGLPFGPLYRVAVPYTVDADQRIRWEPAYGAVWEGGITADEAVMGLAPVSSGEHPTLALLARREGAFTEGDLVGTYYVGAIGFRSRWAVSWWGSVDFDGAGRSTLHLARNADGVVVDERDDGYAGLYEVDEDGSVMWLWSELTPLLSFHGGLLANRDLAVLSAGVFAYTGAHSQYEMQVILVRAAVPPASPVLSGSYHAVGLSAGESGGVWQWTSSTGTASMITTDELVLEDLVLDEDGRILAAPTPTTFTTTPQGQGAFTAVRAADGTPYAGGLSPDGRFAVLAGPTEAIASTVLYFLFR